MQFTLKKGNATAIANSLGGELIEYVKDGVVYTWTGDSNYWPGRAPVLFPNVCTLKDNKVKFGGGEYTIEKHGFARREDFAVVEQSDERIVFEINDTDASLEMYPFHFTLRIAHTLLDNGFKTEYFVVNKNNGGMIFCIGGHPSFRVPLREGERFTDFNLVFEKAEEKFAYVTENGLMNEKLTKVLNFSDERTLPLRYEVFADDALIFLNLKSKKVSLLNNGHGIEFLFDGFPALGIWTPPHKNAPFICLEPWYGVPAYVDEDGNFENKPFAVNLPAEKTFSACYEMHVID